MSVWYAIRVTHIKSHAIALDFWPPNRYELDLSNEVLHSLLGQETAKTSDFKVRGKKRICLISWPWVHQCKIELNQQFFKTPTLTSEIFTASWPLTYKGIECLIWRIWFISVWRTSTQELKAMAWFLCYIGSKYTYFISYRGLC